MMKNSEIKKISIIIPVYNEENTLLELISRIKKTCKKIDIINDYEIIIVDDSSSDNSAKIITKAAQELDSHITAILLKSNYGQHNAIIAGLNQITGDLIITLDSDLQNPPEEILNLVTVASKGYDIVGTIRKNRQDNWFRKCGSKFANYIIRKVTGQAMQDYGCMFRAYRRHVIDAVMSNYKINIFIPILANFFANKTIEVSVTHSEREFGNSKYNFIKLFHLMYDLIICLTNTSPRMLNFIGVNIFFYGLLSFLILMSLCLFTNSILIISGLLCTVIPIYLGIQLISTVFCGEYINKINNCIQVHPSTHFIKCIINKNTISP